MLKRALLAPLLSLVTRYPRFFAVLLVLYVLSPFDLWPEVFTGIPGYLDDLALLAAGFLLRGYLRRKHPAGQEKRPTVVDTTADIQKGDPPFSDGEKP